MNLWKVAWRGLVFHWRSHLGVLLGATVGVAILVGALAVGDSVRFSLWKITESRLGSVQLALMGQNRFFREALADAVSAETKAPIAPIIMTKGTATHEEESGRGALMAGNVQFLGVTNKFWALGNVAVLPIMGEQEGVAINESLAQKIGAKVGSELLLRVDKPSLLSREAPLSTLEDATIAFRLKVLAVVDEARYGRFSLEANQIPPLNIYLPLSYLQSKLGQESRVNTLLVGQRANKPITSSETSAALWKNWTIADSNIEIHEVPATNELALTTPRIFLDPPIGEATVHSINDAKGVLTYFVNEIRAGERATPYSVVCAMDGVLVPINVREDEIIVNQWLADDLQLQVGSQVTLTYYVVGAMRKLETRTSKLTVHSIIPIEGAAADPDLMPFIPGLSDKKNCRDWEPGMPVDLTKIRDKDQAYWNRYKGTPKAFIHLKTGQKIWENRFGNLTSVRIPRMIQSHEFVESCLRQALIPASVGFFFLPTYQEGVQASKNSLDFGLLFMGFSFFLIISALLLTALLFGFGVEQRTEEVGTLLSLGISVRKVRGIFLYEGMVIALLATALGAQLGIYYTRFILKGLSTVWKGAVVNSVLYFHLERRTLFMGAGIGFLVAMFTIWLVVRRQAKHTPRELLMVEAEPPVFTPTPRRFTFAHGLLLVSFLATLLMVSAGWMLPKSQAPEAFFGAGAFLLIAGLTYCRIRLRKLDEGAAEQSLSLRALGYRNAARRWGRSLIVMSLLAVGSFLVIGVGANRHDPNDIATLRDSGTGGFALYATTTLPIYQDLNTKEGQESFRLASKDTLGANFTPFRLKDGDDASCLNLNRAPNPRILGVDPNLLVATNPFSFAQLYKQMPPKTAWQILEMPQEDSNQNEEIIPVVGDANTITWALHKSLGETIPYSDEQGVTRKLRVVGILGNSVLQGNLIMAERHFNHLFPSQSGYRLFLIDMPGAKQEAIDTVQRSLTHNLEDVGMEVTPAVQRYADFNTVENAYLDIFAILGGLGLLLGSAGMAVVVLRNVMERQSELALLRALGFRAGRIRKLIFQEHSLLLVQGLLVGIVSALVAVFPSLIAPGAHAPVKTLALTLLAVFASGLFWTLFATFLALRRPLMQALRND